MQTTLILLTCFLPLVICQNQCRRNACLRAAAGKLPGGPPSSPALQDCNGFLEQTVTPAFVTETVTESFTALTIKTIIVTSTQYAIGGLPTGGSVLTSVRSSTTSPSVISTTKPIPTYASACHDQDAYSSACSCVGGKAVTTTLPAQTITTQTYILIPDKTETVTGTSVTTVAVCTNAVGDLNGYPASVSDTTGTVLQVNSTVLNDVNGLTLPDTSRQACCAACYSTPNCVWWDPGVSIDSPCSIGTLIVDGADDSCSQGLCPHGVNVVHTGFIGGGFNWGQGPCGVQASY